MTGAGRGSGGSGDQGGRRRGSKGPTRRVAGPPPIPAATSVSIPQPALATPPRAPNFLAPQPLHNVEVGELVFPVSSGALEIIESQSGVELATEVTARDGRVMREVAGLLESSGAAYPEMPLPVVMQPPAPARAPVAPPPPPRASVPLPPAPLAPAPARVPITPLPVPTDERAMLRDALGVRAGMADTPLPESALATEVARPAPPIPLAVPLDYSIGPPEISDDGPVQVLLDRDAVREAVIERVSAPVIEERAPPRVDPAYARDILPARRLPPPPTDPDAVRGEPIRRSDPAPLPVVEPTPLVEPVRAMRTPLPLVEPMRGARTPLPLVEPVRTTRTPLPLIEPVRATRTPLPVIEPARPPSDPPGARPRTAIPPETSGLRVLPSFNRREAGGLTPLARKSDPAPASPPSPRGPVARTPDQIGLVALDPTPPRGTPTPPSTTSPRASLPPPASGLAPTPRASGGLAPTPRAPPATGGLAPTPRTSISPSGTAPRASLPAPVGGPASAGAASTGPTSAPPSAPPPAAPLRPAVGPALTAEGARDPLAPRVGQWLNELSRAVRGSRLYADNNAMYRGFLDTSFAQLSELLLHRPEIVLAIGEDRIVFAGDVVHQNSDRVDGLPSLLSQSSLRALTFRRDLTRDELARLIRAIGADYSSAVRSGEDMVTNLWRLALPHFDYACARVLTKPKPSARTRPRPAGTAVPTVDAIVAALAAAPPRAEDTRGFLAGTVDEIMAFERFHGASGDDLDILRLASLFNQTATHPLEREDFVLELELQDQPVELTIRLFDRVLAAVLEEGGFTEESATAAMLVSLYDALLDAGHFVSLTSLVARIASYDTPDARAESPERALIARQILPHIAASDRIRKVLVAYGDAMAAEESGHERAEAILALLTAQGERVAAPVIEHIDAIAKSAWRRTVLDLIGEFGPPNAALLQKRMAAAKHWSVVCDLLALALLLPHEQAAALVLRACRHPEAKVRAEGLRMVGKYQDPQIDALVAQRLRDPDREVRMEALTLAAVRKGDEISSAMGAVMDEDEILSRDQEELRRWCTTYTQLVTFRAVPALARLLQPSLLGRIMPSVEANLAAIEALGTIDHPAARTVLSKALRSLNKSVRAAAKKALDHADLLGFAEPAAPVAGLPALEPVAAPQRALPAPSALPAVSPEEFGDEVRGVISSLFDDGPEPGGPPPARGLPPPRPTAALPEPRIAGALPAPRARDEYDDEAEILPRPGRTKLLPERGGRGDE